MRMNPILKNSTANLFGHLVSKGLKIVLVPLQINLLGEQAFGLVGFYALILSLAAFLDLGLSLTACREVARRNHKTVSDWQAVRNLVRTFEVPYWLIGGLLGILILASAGWFSDNWITASELPRKTIVFSVNIIGLMIAIRWPVSLYRGVLLGLDYQVQANVLSMASEIIAAFGSVLIILAYPSIEAFFCWLFVAGIAETAGHTWYSWRVLSQKGLPRASFCPSELKRVWRYAMGVNVTLLIGSVLGRTDGVILSKLLPISHLGYYSLAQRVPMLVGIFPASLIVATTPALVSDHEQGQSSQMGHLYHRQTRWLSFLGTGLAGALAAFSYPILLLWTQSESVAALAALPFAIVSAATAMDVMTNSANQLSLACGFTGPAIAVNAAAGVVLTAGTLMLAPDLGISGAALAWGAARVMTFILYPLLVHRMVLQGHAKAWFFQDTLPLLAVGGLCFGGGGFLYHLFASSPGSLLWIPSMLAAGLLYVAIVLVLDLMPDWRNLARWRPLTT